VYISVHVFQCLLYNVLCSEVRQYSVAADSTLPTKKRKHDELQESPKKVLIEEIVEESK
jgi:hypothetical protein